MYQQDFIEHTTIKVEHSKTMELLKVVVLVGAFLHITMALSIEGVQKDSYALKKSSGRVTSGSL